MESDDCYQFPKDYATAMVHFYRGELGRMMVWRQRFDTTTHWAIIGLTGIVSFAWNHAGSSNFLFLFANFILYLLLTIEARRYRFYDAYRARVRMLESHFIFPVVTLSSKRLEGNWRRQMGEDLILPSYKISFLEALSRRFRRNYVWIYLILVGTWIVHTIEVRKADSLPTFVEEFCANQPLPDPLFLSLVGAFYVYLLILYAVGEWKRTALGEFQKRPSGGSWNL
ncbi:MAG: DUF2270 domain-containing protein [Oceanipulchritudo sp.]